MAAATSLATEAAVYSDGREGRLGPSAGSSRDVSASVRPKDFLFLRHVIGILERHDIHRIAILTDYRLDEVKRYLGSGAAFRVSLRYPEDAGDLRGSLNAVARAIKTGAISKCEELLVCEGDVPAGVDITALLSRHRKSGAEATVVLLNGFTLPVGTAEVRRGGLVASVCEKPQLGFAVATGYVVLGPAAMSLASRIGGRQKSDITAHLLPALLHEHLKVAAHYPNM